MASFIMAPDETVNKIGTSEEELLDYFSRLPESVIHYILSILPFKDIVRSSVLSKTWNRIWSNYPNIALALSANTYIDTHPLRPFLDHIEGILGQCLFRKVCIQKLQLSITSVSNLEELAPNMDRWLGAAIERNVSELMVKISCLKESVDGPNILYSIPEKVVVAHSLKVLELRLCMFEDRFTCIELPHLQKLKFYWCQFVGENVLNKILCGCPKLEVLEVICEGVGSFLSISCKPRLKYFSIGCTIELKRIEIFAPSLETFKYISRNPCAIDLASCTALKHLELNRAYLSTDHVPIQYLLSKLLYIENLELHDCRALDQIKISSPCLKRLVMGYYCFSFPGAEINIPNLLGLKFTALGACNLDNKFSSWNVPKVEEIHMLFSVKSFWTVCRAGLKGFLMKLHNYENLKLFIKCKGEQNLILHEKLYAVSFSSLNKFLKKAKPENVVISSRREEHLLTNILISEISPVRLSLIFSSRQSIELLYEKLSNAAKLYHQCSAFQLVSTEEIKHEMDSAWKSFMNTHSTGYQTATMIFYRN